MPNILNIGLSGLLTFQRSLAVTSHNVSNVNTEGYTRQRADLTALAGQQLGNGFFGRGVQIGDISSLSNRFIENRLTESITDNGRTARFAELTARLDDLMASEEAGLAPVLENFFAAVQELANDPANPTPRQFMLSEAESLASSFQFLDSQLRGLNVELNSRIETTVADINALADDIARINKNIVIAKGAAQGHPPNDLIDQRQARLNQLANLVAVRTVEQDNGSINVFIGNGQPLVVDATAQALTTNANPADPSLLEVARNSPGSPIVSNQLTGGEIGAVLDFRREALSATRNELGRIGIVLADTFNAQNRRGMDLDGNLGQDVFRVSLPPVFAAATNTGAATVTASFVDTTALTSSDYQLDFDGAQFTLTRLADGFTQTGPGPFTIDGFQVSIAGAAAAGDSFVLKPVSRGAEFFQILTVDPDRIAAADPVTATATLGNIGDGFIAAPSTVDPTNPALQDSVDIVFNTPPGTFDVIDVGSGTTIAAGVAFTAGAAIAFNGWSTRIDGLPLAGDSFRVESNLGGISDNRNALALGALQASSLVEGKSSYGESYATLVGGVGIRARQASFNAEANERLLADATTARESLSGVNLDEEAIDLTRYQQAYQAMARVIDTSNTLFDTLIAAIQ